MDRCGRFAADDSQVRQAPRLIQTLKHCRVSMLARGSLLPRARQRRRCGSCEERSEPTGALQRRTGGPVQTGATRAWLQTICTLAGSPAFADGLWPAPSVVLHAC